MFVNLNCRLLIHFDLILAVFFLIKCKERKKYQNNWKIKLSIKVKRSNIMHQYNKITKSNYFFNFKV